jgi:glycosyltransferase involved in cell wall biosynthesis
MFSLVMPTRNRSHLLRNALRSAMAQNFDDYEIVVSNNDSHDETEAVVREFEHKRLRLVRTEKMLPMPEHWEFAVEHAQGEYVMFLCDDDAISPNALGITAEVLQQHKVPLVMLGGTVYWGESAIDTAVRNAIMVPYFQGHTEIVDSKKTLAAIGRFEPQPLFLPRMLNSFCRRDLLFNIRAEAKRLFLLSPDYSFAVMTLAGTPQWAYIHLPLWVCGCFKESTGMSTVQNRDGASRKYVEEIGDKDMQQNTPMRRLLLNNALADTYLESKKQLPRLLSDFEIDWTRYFVACWTDIIILEAYGSDVRPDIAEFQSALKQQPEEIRRRVASDVNSLMMRILRFWGYRIPRKRWLVKLGSRFTHNSRFYWGDECGFSNIFEASQMLPKVSPPKRSGVA